LVVEIQDVQPFQDQPWGFTGVFHRQNGGGFLDEIYPEASVCQSCKKRFLLTMVTTEQRQFGTLRASFAPLVTSRTFVSRVSFTPASWGVLPRLKYSLNGTSVKAN
jgi:hypothetical protein